MTGPSTALCSDPREPYGRIFHEQGRLTVNAELPDRQRRGIGPWEEREPMQQEIDMRGASAVAGRAVLDAGIDLAACHAEIMELRAQLSAFTGNLPAVLRALTIAAGETTYESEARPYRVARQALGSGEGE